MSNMEKRPGLPGDGSHKTRRARMIRVNQAGEFGAKQIYAGQLAILGHTEIGETIAQMKDQEQVHLDTFNELMVEENVRPTALTPLWSVAGFALGAGTAMLGKDAAMACTVAVEDVIDEHYRRQSAVLEDGEPLKATIDQFRAEELQHRDTALDAGAKKAPGYRLLTTGIRAATKLAIGLSTRI
jgi:ubiquinone biosynthesis monooxygenase Coq7